MIPFYLPFVNDDIIDNLIDTIKSGWITTGPQVKILQEEVAIISGVNDVLCVNSATSALTLALHWYGVKPGDEVIIPAYTFAATALAVLHLGAKPVMVDIKDDFCIDTSKLTKAITEKTKVIMPVDMAGLPCDYNEIYDVVNSKEVKDKFKPLGDNQKKLGRVLILSDAAHSIGARYRGRPTGSLADLTVFSFHAVKNISSAEGGAICINLPLPFDNKKIYDFLRLISFNGQTKDAYAKTMGAEWKYDIIYPGFKINMPDILASIAVAQFQIYKKELYNRRKEIFAHYDKAFEKISWAISPPSLCKKKESSYHVYLLRIKDITEAQRDLIIEEIFRNGVSVNVHFQPLPMLTVFKNLNYKIEDYPVSYKNYSIEISLPVYPQLTNDNISYIVDCVIKAYNKILGTN
ncbi:MAG: DegT/DnrJ/EryC1/StrS family aminotransferase [Ignavibacteria bacterium]|nr:DegT/DnrJ/EryC1/StrS family aminotransferase [Ignavibacteria bacterium]